MRRAKPGCSCNLKSDCRVNVIGVVFGCGLNSLSPAPGNWKFPIFKLEYGEWEEVLRMNKQCVSIILSVIILLFIALDLSITIYRPAYAEEVTFSLPVRLADKVPADGLPEQFFLISFYLDHNPDDTIKVDYNCGTRTYNNHSGIDFGAYPLSWNKMRNNEIEVVAAAPGVIEKKAHGYEDGCRLGQTSNALRIRHDDGSQTRYVHLKKDSLTSKNVGDRVERGEYLGVMGSSGDSGGPHLHFKVVDADGNVVDPFAGPCNPTTSRSWWNTQLPYTKPGVSQVIIGNAKAKTDPECSADGSPPAQDPHTSENFQAGDKVYCNGYFRYVPKGQKTEWRIYQPDGSLYKKLRDWNFKKDFKWRYWNYRSFKLPKSPLEGTWKCEIRFAGKAYAGYFNVNDPTYIKIKQPNRNEVFEKGRAYKIRWGDNLGGNVRIALYKNTTYHSNIAYSIASNGNYQWTVPRDIPESSDYAIRITNITVPSLYDESDVSISTQK